ncbi:unnamed protein product [Didymodactylos carnosus]|uniref:DNA 3'-5' helicase n=1 Tax=Didymodactylos carnosus TaxID=1234261 RepID=A0A815JI25_9BILA|nr:unnamed protein product [Didymodactylos carnosus]CAF1381372.1 unnamed protein product [Didymodactylos carnosus]CAF3996210.1 unnamed protein product [Didymodactylos carnosus]CAF4276383.1 unnamed protein product [Didymodactylos carnosus]
MEQYPDLRRVYQQKFYFILVDEFQDTSKIQFDWVKLLLRPKNNDEKVNCFMAVADDDQSIYSFRGAKAAENVEAYLKTMKLDRNNSKDVIKLEQNYRSTDIVLRAANAVIANNKARLGKSWWTDMKNGERISLCQMEDNISEAKYVVDVIREFKQQNSTISYSQIAILYRTNAQYVVNGEEIYRKPKSNAKLHEQANYVFNQAQIIDHYKKKHENERVDNIQEFSRSSLRIIYVSLQDNSPQDGKIDSSHIDAVQLMTVHGSKGLEFHYVFIVGLNEGLFPSSFSDTDEEEDRRLMYVAITRAKRVLHLTHSRRRMHFGEWKNCQRSKFLNEIPIDLIRQIYDPQLKFNSKNDTTPSPHKKMKTTATTTPMAFMSGSSLLKLNNNKKTNKSF